MKSILVTPDALERRRGDVAASADLRSLDARLRAGIGEFAARPLYVPEAKALLSRWGGVGGSIGSEPGISSGRTTRSAARRNRPCSSTALVFE